MKTTKVINSLVRQVDSYYLKIFLAQLIAMTESEEKTKKKAYKNAHIIEFFKKQSEEDLVYLQQYVEFVTRLVLVLTVSVFDSSADSPYSANVSVVEMGTNEKIVGLLQCLKEELDKKNINPI